MADTPSPAPAGENKDPKPAEPAAGATPPAAGTPAAKPAPLTDEEKAAKIAAAKEAAEKAKAAKAAAGGAAPTTAPAGAAPAAAAAKPVAPAAAGAAAAKPAAPAAAKPAASPPGPKTPKGSEVPLPPPPQLQTRRTFMEWSFAAWLIFFAWLAGISHLFLRFMFPNVLYEQDPRFVAGKKSDFPEINKVYESFTQSQAVWIVRLIENGQDRLVVLSTVCTHLGCTPNWLEAEKKYKCPCHGSGYYMDGVNFEGPTPRPLERFRVFVDATGNIVVDKARKYRQDLAQWNENESFVLMA